jgi:hypothetical protein
VYAEDAASAGKFGAGAARRRREVLHGRSDCRCRRRRATAAAEADDLRREVKRIAAALDRGERRRLVRQPDQLRVGGATAVRTLSIARRIASHTPRRG